MSRQGKVGRNETCPCGSGKKFKQCCLNSNPNISISPPYPPKALIDSMNQRQKPEQRFGEVRPFISTYWRGERCIAVGNELHHSDKWKTLIDFLFDYPKHVLTPSWGKQELAKPLAERHPVMQWYDSMCRHRAKQVPGRDGVYEILPNGATRAYLLLSYDLYTLRHHSALLKTVVGRLMHKDQFQGARHELFAAATCIRAGYTIEIEDESDRTQKHAEFVATHRYTNQSICVEAKSRHRQGILGQPGTRSPDYEVRVRIRGLLNSALKKPVSHPFVIFLDLNLPPSSPVPLNQEWLQKIVNPILQDREKQGTNDPWNLLVFSNFPDHYVNDEQPAPAGYVSALIGRNPKVPAVHQEAILTIFDAALKFGHLPNSFDELL